MVTEKGLPQPGEELVILEQPSEIQEDVQTSFKLAPQKKDIIEEVVTLQQAEEAPQQVCCSPFVTSCDSQV